MRERVWLRQTPFLVGVLVCVLVEVFAEVSQGVFGGGSVGLGANRNFQERLGQSSCAVLQRIRLLEYAFVVRPQGRVEQNSGPSLCSRFS